MGEIVKNIKRTLYVPYRWSYGKFLSRFFQETRENKRFMGVRCQKCKKVLVPPIVMCGRCFSPVADTWVPVSDHGILESFTIVYLSFPGQPTTPPYVYAMIRLDGADTLFPHIVGGIEFEKITMGMRLQAVWNDDRKGDMYDVKYFVPEIGARP